MAWNSTCFRQIVCPSSGVHSLYTQQCYMVYRFVESFRAGPFWSCSRTFYKPMWPTPLLSVQWMNSWWWTDDLSETCRISCQNKFVKLLHLVGFTIKKFQNGLEKEASVKKCWHLNFEVWKDNLFVSSARWIIPINLNPRRAGEAWSPNPKLANQLSILLKAKESLENHRECAPGLIQHREQLWGCLVLYPQQVHWSPH